MDGVTDLVKAVASLLWPILAFWIVYLFKEQIGDAIGRLRKVESLGQKLELDATVQTLQQSASQSFSEVAALPKPKEEKSEDHDDNQHIGEEDDAFVRSVIQESGRSPKAALLILADEIEREAIQTLASVGKFRAKTRIPIAQVIRDLDSHYGLPRHMSSSLKLFWDTRNKIIHGGETEERNVLSAIDSGLTILKSLQVLPRETHMVYETQIPIYLDPRCKDRISDATGVILESRSASGLQTAYRIFPTTRTHFEKGRRVAWEWNMNNVWEGAWYRDPQDLEKIKLAWNGSAEFIGRHLEDF